MEASNNFCTGSYDSQRGWVYLLDLDRIGSANYKAYAMITADCNVVGNTILSKETHIKLYPIIQLKFCYKDVKVTI